MNTETNKTKNEEKRKIARNHTFIKIMILSLKAVFEITILLSMHFGKEMEEKRI